MFRRNCHFGSYQESGNNKYTNHRNPFDKIQQHLFKGAGFDDSMRRKSQVAVNILENDGYYQVQVFAAGRRKEQFKVSIANQILTVSATAIETDNGLKAIYEEMPTEAFERAFKLQDDIVTDRVNASYEEGVLTIILQKDPEKVASNIEVPVS